MLYCVCRRLVLNPLCQQLRSPDPDTAAAGRTLALQSALAIRQSGMLQGLQDMCNNHAANLGSALGIWELYLQVVLQDTVMWCVRVLVVLHKCCYTCQGEPLCRFCFSLLPRSQSLAIHGEKTHKSAASSTLRNLLQLAVQQDADIV